jgi:hypothetical protein
LARPSNSSFISESCHNWSCCHHRQISVTLIDACTMCWLTKWRWNHLSAINRDVANGWGWCLLKCPKLRWWALGENLNLP